MITAATVLMPGMPVKFPSPRSGRVVPGRVRSDRGTYASVEWDEDGAGLATCMYKGLITCPESEHAESPSTVEFRQLSLSGRRWRICARRRKALSTSNRRTSGAIRRSCCCRWRR